MKPARTWHFLLAIGLCSVATADEEAARIVILANSADRDSLRIARHYAEARGVPERNIIALPLSFQETIVWREFVSSLWNPLLAELVRAGWIDAIPMALSDPVGRGKYAPQGHRVGALVVCRGVPLRVSHEPEFYLETSPVTRRSEFRTNAGCVDAELSLLAQPNYSINGFVPNPLFEKENPTPEERAQVIKVARLDGPTVHDALALVDRALAAEKTGLLGRAYVDLSHRDPVGDAWLEAAAKQLVELGFDVTADREPAPFPLGARMDAPVMYFGWYAGDVTGPFTLPGFRFPPGAIALHIHSYSAHTLRSATSGWAGPFVSRGVTATVGNVHEPYLQLTHQPHLLLRALSGGKTWVDAAYYSLKVLSWQSVVIGDPLYRPFAERRPAGTAVRRDVPSLIGGYGVLEQMGVLERAGRSAEATALGAAALRKAPSLALALELARRHHAAGERDAAIRTLGFVSRLERLPADQWAVAREAACLLADCGDPATGVAIWKLLCAQPGMPVEVQRIWLPQAVDTAKAARDPHAAEWQREFERLTATANAN